MTDKTTNHIGIMIKLLMIKKANINKNITKNYKHKEIGNISFRTISI